jgi:predicted Zn-dependent peptidase
MTTTESTLTNGLRIVSHRMPHLETVSLGVWVGAGARHETAAENGISHFLEHMAFKGTARRTARVIAEEIESVGGDLNAATSLEATAYFARVLKGDERVALDIIADILQNSALDMAEIERERDVILQEIAGISDSPDELVYDLVQDVAFPDQPIGRPVIGTAATVRSFTPAALRSFLARRYLPGRMVLAAAGAIEHAVLHRHAEALFGALTPGRFETGEPARYGGGVRSSAKPFEQSHLLIGFAGPSYLDAAFYDAQVLSGLLGGGMSSRLFQEVRENRGLCYSIYTSAWGMADAGLFSVHAATGQETMSELIAIVGQELRQIAAEAPSPAEVARAKAQLKVGLLMSLESSSSRAEQMARQIINIDRLISAAELVERVEAVTGARVRALAEKLLSSAPPSIAVVGAGPKSGRYASDTARTLST